jgi:hypothetical protein
MIVYKNIKCIKKTEYSIIFLEFFENILFMRKNKFSYGKSTILND